jgi:hypothetical protein
LEGGQFNESPLDCFVASHRIAGSVRNFNRLGVRELRV